MMNALRRTLLSKPAISPLPSFLSRPVYSTDIKQRKEGKPPTTDLEKEESDEMKLDLDLIHHLERTSLVDFGDEEALQRLEEAVKFANTLFQVDTEGVEPLTSVLEDETLYLREDKPETTSRSNILMNAGITEEDYFVAPPGNVPLEPQTQSFKKRKK